MFSTELALFIRWSYHFVGGTRRRHTLELSSCSNIEVHSAFRVQKHEMFEPGNFEHCVDWYEQHSIFVLLNPFNLSGAPYGADGDHSSAWLGSQANLAMA